MFENEQTKKICILIVLYAFNYNEIKDNEHCDQKLTDSMTATISFTGVSIMKIAAFYENILEGARKAGITDCRGPDYTLRTGNAGNLHQL